MKNPEYLTLVSDTVDGKVRKYYRCAGYRHPNRGELYVAKDAKIKKSNGAHTDGDRLIVREIPGFNTILDYGDRAIPQSHYATVAERLGT